MRQELKALVKSAEQDMGLGTSGPESIKAANVQAYYIVQALCEVAASIDSASRDSRAGV